MELPEFICEELSKNNDQEYKWGYKISDPVSWVPEYLMKSDIINDSKEVLDRSGSVLNSALVLKNQDLTFKAIRTIMDWGGVYYPLGPRPGNRPSVERKLAEDILLDEVLYDYEKLFNGDLQSVNLMNAGWTKVWSVLFDNRYVMFDSRVSYAFSLMIYNYCERSEQKTREFSNEIKFRQIKQGRRYVKGIRCVNGSSRNWAVSMGVVSIILQECLKLAKMKDIDITKGQDLNLRNIEARLFMIGA